jgi:exopolysaccharide biosynthesis protein
VTVDGRQPAYSVGVTLQELQDLALAMGLSNALNLDGGGSTTMVVGGAIMNRPSDALGPRAVSDVLLVRSPPGRPPAVAR